MALGDRKLVPNEPVLNLTESCMHFCNSTIKVDNSTTGFCPPPCLVACPLICLQPLVPHLLPPSSPSHSSSYSPSVSEPNESHSLSPILISMLIILASTFLIVFFYVIYLKFYSSSSSSQTNRRRRRGTGTTLPSPGPNGGHHRQRSDGTFGDAPVHIVDLDHPIWYIATVGLQPSVIKSITACKYKKSDGVIEGTDCAVCLTEFEEEDILRLLPKCNHAFHISCIDTWLRSHKNCPLCRAPIVSDSHPRPVRIGNLMTVPAAVGDSRNENETSGGAGEARIRVEEAEEERGDLDGAADDGGGRRAQSNKEKELRENSAASRRSASMERSLDVELATDEVASSSSGGQRTRGSSGASASVRWLVGGRSLSCSGKIFSSRYSRGG